MEQEQDDEKLKAEIEKGVISSLPIIGRQPKNEKEKKYFNEFIDYEFFNLETPGMSESFSYGSTKINHFFKFKHGRKYKVPRFIAGHVESRSTPIWKYKPDGTGSIKKTLIGSKPRFRMSRVFD